MPDAAGCGRAWVRALGVAVAAAALLWLPASALAASGAPALSGAVSNSTDLAGTTAVASAGNYAYAAAYGPGQLTAVDTSNPASPAVAGSSAAASSLMNATNIAIAGGYAYVVSKNRNASMVSNDDGSGNSLTILDVHSNPAAPSIVGSLHDAANLFGAYGIALSGSDAFIAAQGCLSGQPCSDATVGNAFATVDVSNPATPTLLGALHNDSLPSPWTTSNALDHATSVAISGHYAYVTAAYSDRLTVIDISNPSAPTIVASLLDTTNLAFPVDVAVQGNYAYVADQGSGPGFTVVDISNPLHPAIVTTVSNSALSGAYRVKVSGDFAYVSGSSAAAMSVIDISDPTNPVLVWSDTDAAHFWRTTGLSFDPVHQFLIASSPYTQAQSNPVYPPFGTNSGTVSVIALEPAPISVAIAPATEPPAITSSTIASFQFATNNQVEAVQCALDGASPGPCTSTTSQQYTGLALGAHTFTVEGVDPAGNTTSATYAWTIAPTIPTDTGAPTIAGTALGGQTLAANPGTWIGAPAPAFAYQWQRCNSVGSSCGAITGANGSTYTLSAADVGATVRVLVTASNTSGSAAATSNPTARVAATPQNTTPPSISGVATAQQTLTATPGTWSGAPTPTLTYQWQRCNAQAGACSAITGATANRYKLSAADVHSTIEVVVAATNSAGAVSAASKATATVRALATKPAIKVLTLSVAHSRGSYTAHIRLNNPGTLTLTLRRTKPRAGSVLARISRRLPRGSSSLTLHFRARPGTYSVTATTRAGTKRTTFKVRAK
jgi:hypothetical protein